MGLEGWLFVSFVIIVVLLVVKVVSKKQSLATHMTLALFIFFALSIGYIVINNEVDFTSIDGIVSIIRIYFSWLVNLGNNVVETTGYVINQDWGLNSTNSTG